MESREHLWDEQRGGRTLHDAGDDQDADGGSETADRRGHDEADERTQEEPVPTVAVPQAAAHDQQGRVRHAVPGDHQLQLAGRGV